MIATLDKETIDNLKAGPETDALVAEALGCKFGWHHPRTYYTDCIKPYSTDWGAVMEAWGSLWTDEGLRDYAKRYEEDLCSPLEAFASVTRYTGGWRASIGAYCRSLGKWAINSVCESRAPTGPMAICKVILRWKSPTVQT